MMFGYFRVQCFSLSPTQVGCCMLRAHIYWQHLRLFSSGTIVIVLVLVLVLASLPVLDRPCSPPRTVMCTNGAGTKLLQKIRPRLAGTCIRAARQRMDPVLESNGTQAVQRHGGVAT